MTGPAPLLKVQGLDLVCGPAAEPITLLRGFDLKVAAGEFVAVVGESGSGKTMAARSILGLLPPGVRRGSGSIVLDGRELTTLPPEGLRAVRGRDVGMVFQEPMVSLNPALTVGRQLAEGLELHTDLSDAAIRARCLEMLARVQIKDPARCLAAYPHEFSGGMRQRIMLASVMLLKPRLLIADEPTTALDTLSQREVMELMVELSQDSGTAVLLITHDLGVVARYAKRIVVLEKGLLVETGETRQVLAHPEHPYTQRLVAALPKRGEHQSRPPEGAPLLEVSGCCITYPGKAGLLRRAPPTPVVQGLDLQVAAGEIVAVVGASGSGKTTVGRAVLGLKAIETGAIAFDGVRLDRMTAADRKRFRQEAQLVFQDPFSSLDPRMRVGEAIGASLRHAPEVSAAERRARVAAMLEEVSLAGFEDRFPHQMSGGQRQRVAIARALVSRPRLVVADEPVAALDMTIQLQVLTLFRKLQAQYGFACLFITHDLGVVEEIADRVYVMSAGKVVEEGPTNAVFDAPKDPYTRALLAATPSRMAAAMALEGP
ncbi:MAG TPA: ABC transporter ATP-binding protein [Caulobacteraceae bacterium]